MDRRSTLGLSYSKQRCAGDMIGKGSGPVTCPTRIIQGFSGQLWAPVLTPAADERDDAVIGFATVRLEDLLAFRDA